MKITKSQLRQIIKEELNSTLKEAASPDSPGLLRAIWNMIKDEFDEDYHGSYEPDDMAMSQGGREEQEEEERRKRDAQHSTASSHRDAYYSGGHYDPTLEEVIKKEVRKLLKTKK